MNKNIIKIYQSNGKELGFATANDSGIDCYANALTMVVSTTKEMNKEVILITEEEFNDYKGSQICIRDILLEKLANYLRRHSYLDDELLTIYFQYFTGTRVILDKIDLKAYPKSSKQKVAPFLSNLANGVGVVDEEYRGIIRFTYQLDPNLVTYLEKASKSSKIADAVRYLMNGIYLPSMRVGVGQLVPPKGLFSYEIENLEVWNSSYEDTERGVGGHGSTSR